MDLREVEIFGIFPSRIEEGSADEEVDARRGTDRLRASPRGGVKVEEVFWNLGIAEATFYVW